MRCGWKSAPLCSCLAVALLAGDALAGWWPHFCHKTAEIPYGKTTEADHTMERAGYPMEVSRCAAPVETCAYVGYPVGGGAPCKGDHPGPAEGTWGWDYQGRCIKRHVFLWWWHGKCQGGEGAYKTDGPRCEHE